MKQREIKFRAWIESNKRMDYFNLDSLLYEDGNYYEWDGNKRNYPIMQFTGLLDKNGKEIYEGDILLAKEKLFGDPSEEKFKQVVKFEDGAFVVGSVNLSIITELSGNGLSFEPEIIGNIYEGLHSDEKTDILDECQKELKDFKKDTKSVEKPE